MRALGEKDSMKGLRNFTCTELEVVHLGQSFRLTEDLPKGQPTIKSN